MLTSIFSNIVTDLHNIISHCYLGLVKPGYSLTQYNTLMLARLLADWVTKYNILILANFLSNLNTALSNKM